MVGTVRILVLSGCSHPWTHRIATQMICCGRTFLPRDWLSSLSGCHGPVAIGSHPGADLRVPAILGYRASLLSCRNDLSDVWRLSVAAKTLDHFGRGCPRRVKLHSSRLDRNGAYLRVLSAH